MSLDIYLSVASTEVYSANITHNLGKMAEEAGVYQILWRQENTDVKTAGDLVEPLQKAIIDMKADPERFKQHNASNGWGLYKHFLPWLEKLLNACQENPAAAIGISR